MAKTKKEKPEKKEEAETAMEVKKPDAIMTVAIDDSAFSGYLDTAKFNQLWRVANVFAASELVPAHYREKPNNCFIATQMAIRMEVDPMMFMQNTFVVHGTPGMLATLVIALINSRGPFTGPVQWKFTGGEGKNRACTAYAEHKVTGEVCEAEVSWKMVEDEGWAKKAGSKWLTMPDQMFKYRSAVFLGRLFCPECLMGMKTIDEIVDIDANEKSFSHAKAKAEVTIENEAGSKPVDTDFEPETQEQPDPEPESQDNDDWQKD